GASAGLGQAADAAYSAGDGDIAAIGVDRALARTGAGHIDRQIEVEDREREAAGVGWIKDGDLEGAAAEVEVGGAVAFGQDRGDERAAIEVVGARAIDAEDDSAKDVALVAAVLDIDLERATRLGD